MNNTSQEKNKQKKRIARGRWAQIPMQVWKECSHSQLCVYGALSLLQGTNDYTWASVEVIGEHAGYSKSTTDRTIRELIKLGWIGRIKQFGRPSKVFVYMDCTENDKIRLNMLEGKKQANKEFSEKMKEKKKVKKLIDTPNLSNNDNSNLSVSVPLNLSKSDTPNLSDSIYNNQFTNNNYNKHVREESPIPERVFGKTEQPHTQKDPELNDPKIRELAMAFGIDLDNPATQTEEESQLATTKQDEIEQHYSNEIAKVEQEYNLQRDINIPKLSIDSLLTASEDFLGRVGIGFDNNPRRILNLIYKQLPKDFVIKEDSKDVEILGDMIRKYTSSGKDERESIAKRIYQSVEAMLKIYVIKKYGEPYREVIFPDIAKANLALYLNCNPTFKYCLGGFSNDIDGVYTEICRLAEKDAKKKVNAIKIEHEKKVRQLEANRQTELQSVFSPEQRANFQKQNDEILRRMDAKGDIEDQPLAKPIQANLTDDERAELNLLFVKADKTQDDVIRLKFLVKKSRK
jgi:predicted transcriptional regulator